MPTPDDVEKALAAILTEGAKSADTDTQTIDAGAILQQGIGDLLEPLGGGEASNQRC